MKNKTTWIRVSYIIMLLAILQAGCSNDDIKPGETDPETGYLTGEVKDQAGKPLEGVKIIIDNSIFFNSAITTFTNGEGRYKVRVPTGSWYAFASHQVTYDGDRYSFYLHPDISAGFGGEGGVRNFAWKLSGEMPSPLSGYYGGLVTFDNFPGVYISQSEIDFVFTPLNMLVDGSVGQPLNRRADDSYQIRDIPVGRYKLEATYQGKPLQFRRWNSDDPFTTTYELRFKSRIEAQCDNCEKLEYFLAP